MKFIVYKYTNIEDELCSTQLSNKMKQLSTINFPNNHSKNFEKPKETCEKILFSYENMLEQSATVDIIQIDLLNWFFPIYYSSRSDKFLTNTLQKF